MVKKLLDVLMMRFITTIAVLVSDPFVVKVRYPHSWAHLLRIYVKVVDETTQKDRTRSHSYVFRSVLHDAHSLSSRKHFISLLRAVPAKSG